MESWVRGLGHFWLEKWRENLWIGSGESGEILESLLEGSWRKDQQLGSSWSPGRLGSSLGDLERVLECSRRFVSDLVVFTETWSLFEIWSLLEI